MNKHIQAVLIPLMAFTVLTAVVAAYQVTKVVVSLDVNEPIEVSPESIDLDIYPCETKHFQLIYENISDTTQHVEVILERHPEDSFLSVFVAGDDERFNLAGNTTVTKNVTAVVACDAPPQEYEVHKG